MPLTVQLQLKLLLVSLKIITGNYQYIAESVVKQIGSLRVKILTGTALRGINDLATIHRANRTAVLAEVEPNQKERIIWTLKKPDTLCFIWAAALMMFQQAGFCRYNEICFYGCQR